MYELVIFLCKTALLLLPFVGYLVYLKFYRRDLQGNPSSPRPELRKISGGSPAILAVKFKDEERFYLAGEGYCIALEWMSSANTEP